MDDPEARNAAPAEGFARAEDGFERLWTPHRMAYISSEKPPASDTGDCPFCGMTDADDAERLIVARGETCYVVLNLFPYNPGHVLICPYRHVADYVELEPDELAEFTELTRHAVRALTAASHPHGFNLGMNQGAVAGAGVAAHLHQHVVPRWGGDANFLPIIGQTKALPVLLEETRQRLRDAW